MHRSENREENSIYIEHGTTGGDLEPSISVRQTYDGAFYIGHGDRGEDSTTSTAEEVVKELGRFYRRNKNFSF